MSQDRFLSHTYLTNDNAYQSSFKQYVGYEKNFTFHPKDTLEPDRLLSVTPMIGWRCYFYNGLENHYTDVRTNVSYKYSNRLCGSFNLSFLSSKDWSPMFYDGYIRYSRKKFAYELYRERETVGTPVTNNLRYISSFTGLSVDFRLTRRLTLVNSLAYNDINDGNRRWFQTMRFISTIKNRSYVDLKVRKMYGGEWSPYYFSPSYINQYNVGYGFYKPVYKDKFTTKFYFGAGVQEIDNYYMYMFNLDLKVTTDLKSKWNYEFALSSRNFNTYLYNTFTFKVYYTFANKKVSDK
jgi:hypothetical protein